MTLESSNYTHEVKTGTITMKLKFGKVLSNFNGDLNVSVV